MTNKRKEKRNKKMESGMIVFLSNIKSGIKGKISGIQEGTDYVSKNYSISQRLPHIQYGSPIKILKILSVIYAMFFFIIFMASLMNPYSGVLPALIFFPPVIILLDYAYSRPLGVKKNGR